jgi:hypothetical protein
LIAEVILKFIFLFVLFSSSVFSQNISDPLAQSFLNALISDSPDLERFVLKSELNLSKRLGISYPDAKHKFLISNDVDTKIKEDLKNGSMNYNYNIDSIDQDYSILNFKIPARQIKNEYYFYRSKLISKPYYFARNWEIEISKYFVFHISEPNLFNKYSQNRLDSFVDDLLLKLIFNESEKTKLQKEKIHYYLCKDEDEIELLTNYKARGLYYIPYDYIISTFNCHYHELVHLLVNYKLKKLNLYTLPLLQEGLAVANGGRGGKEPNVILSMGLFLAQSNFIDYKSLLSKSQFYQMDPSMTYPIAGLYTKFLIQSLGIKKYLEFYKNYSSDTENINSIKIDISELPSETKWQKFLSDPANENSISVSVFDESDFPHEIVKNDLFSILENENKYLFKIKDIIGIHSDTDINNYDSNLFRELFPNKTYKNEKYIIIANTDEVSIYNLFSNNLIAKYVKAFSIYNEKVDQQDGFFIFTINKNVFDEVIKTENEVSIIN